jgi:hypothetical protein
MKQNALLDRIQRGMRPGILTRDGLLGHDTRNLLDILVDDAANVGRLGVTHEEIAQRMRELRDAGAAGLGEPTRVDPSLEVRVDSARGRLACPFGHRGLFRKTNTTVRNLDLDREITYTDLGIHMIEAHGFYQGLGSPFRLNPADLARVLRIAPSDAR